MQNLRPTYGRCYAVSQWSPLVWFCLSAIVCFGLFIGSLLVSSASRHDQPFTVRIYCASAVVKPMIRIVDQFNSSELATSEKVIVEIVREGGSGALAGQISTEAQTGVLNMADIFVCADSNRMSDLVDENAIINTFPIAAQHPVIAVRDEGDSDLLRIDNMQSLLNFKTKLGVGSITSAIGFETLRLARQEDCLELLQTRRTAEFENVMSLAQALSIGSVDAAVLWDSTVHQFNQTDNQPIKIVAYFNYESSAANSKPENLVENGSYENRNFRPSERFGKFSPDKSTASIQTGCFVEVGRSVSISPQADHFLNYLKSNRQKILDDFVDAGFSNYQIEPVDANGRQPNKQ